MARTGITHLDIAPKRQFHGSSVGRRGTLRSRASYPHCGGDVDVANPFGSGLEANESAGRQDVEPPTPQGERGADSQEHLQMALLSAYFAGLERTESPQGGDPPTAALRT